MNRIPRRIALGADRVIAVKQVPPSVVAGIVSKEDVAAWDRANDTIWIDRTVSHKRKWRAYRHELLHALTDVHDEENGGI
jgi:hypothetical protein